jgi:DNA-directed RNA polymerase subunit RPC12/RpoP
MNLVWNTGLTPKRSRRFIRVYKCAHCGAIFEDPHIFIMGADVVLFDHRRGHECEENIEGFGEQVAIRHLGEA